MFTSTIDLGGEPLFELLSDGDWLTLVFSDTVAGDENQPLITEHIAWLEARDGVAEAFQEDREAVLIRPATDAATLDSLGEDIDGWWLGQMETVISP